LKYKIPYIQKYQTVPISIFNGTTTSRDKKYGYRVNYRVIYDYHDYRASVVAILPSNHDYRVNYRVKTTITVYYRDYHGLGVITNRVTSF
jgi:hypothetical protein